MSSPQLEIVVNRKELQAELAAVAGVVETKTTIPILANLLLNAPEMGNSAQIRATNLDQSLTTSVPAKIKSPGTATVPARKLYEYVKLLSGDEVTIGQEENHWLQIKCGRSKTRMVGMSPANYPEMPTVDAWHDSIDLATLKAFIERALLSVSHEESRYTLNAALLIFDGNMAEMVSTDGHRLTHISRTVNTVREPRKMLIPGGTLKELHALLRASDANVVQIAETPNNLFFGVGYRLLTSAKITGQFPNYQAVIPKDHPTMIELDVATASQTINRCMVFSEETTSQVVVTLNENLLEVKCAAAEIGETSESIDIIRGPKKEQVAGYNGEYLQDFLAKVSGHVEMHFKDGQSPAKFVHRTDDGITFAYVVMPMRIGGGK